MRVLAFLGLTCLILAGGCAPQAPPAFPPQELKGAKTSPDLSMVRQDPEDYRGKTVLLGGQVLAVQTPQSGIRQIEVSQSLLDSQGMPTLQPGSGRFLVIVEEALGVPEVHIGCRLAVLGEILGLSRQELAGSVYPYVLVKAREIRMWPAGGGKPLYPLRHFPWEIPLRGVP